MVIRRVERDANQVSAAIILGNQEHHLRFAASEDIGKEVDFLLPAAMLLAMRTRARLKLPGEVSPRLLSAVSKIQDFFRLWDDEKFRRVPVEARVRNLHTERALGVACFFSGGVDSFYTLLKRREEVTHLIFVHGFDIRLARHTRRTEASQMARAVAKELDKPLIEVETNLLGSFSNWLLHGNEYHGAVLASVALLFQHRFCKVLIPASFNYARLVPYGTHPVLDPLWSTELTDFEHDGCEATRVEKVAYVSQYELPMKWLRVCLRKHAYNCGRCEKCLRTMISLRIAGALERCKTLPNDLDLDAVANMDLSDDNSRSLARQNLKALERLGSEPELTRALAEALYNSEARADKQVKRTAARLAKLEARNQKLARRNSQLTARYSSRRYRLADSLANSVLRIPAVGKLVQRKGTPDDRAP